MNYLYPHQVLYLHKRVVETSGGSPGVRDQGLLESAVYRPQASFGGADLYPDLFAKAAALGHSIISNHPFIDGNKRTGFEAMRLMLRINGWDVKAAEDEKYALVIKAASNSAVDEHRVAEWLKAHSAKR
ncbi:MAG: type II toxin-antitoxin system death-on-curing family toxin [Elusimicrobia bacterium]|nr:type II toxin-antitoxin system death-on-curing family toxin [Elusimicrobiota bacterium]